MRTGRTSSPVYMRASQTLRNGNACSCDETEEKCAVVCFSRVGNVTDARASEVGESTWYSWRAAHPVCAVIILPVLDLAGQREVPLAIADEGVALVAVDANVAIECESVA